jgi:predicted AAA+ superfamily ATPase
MPLSNEEWDSGRTADTLEGRILKFLKINMKPFSLGEIINGLGYSNDLNVKNIVETFAIQNALDKLVKEGNVTARTIKQQIEEQVYYKAVEPRVH